MSAGRENVFGMFGNNSRSSNMLDKSGDGINVSTVPLKLLNTLLKVKIYSIAILAMAIIWKQPHHV